MLKRTIQFVLVFIVLLMIGLFVYFYYIKPQREYIRVNTQQCISKAMTSINEEVVKNAPDTYISENGFVVMRKTQKREIDNCFTSYQTILFSRPEYDLLILNTQSLLDDQSDKITEYLKKIEDKKAAIKAVADKQLASQKQAQAAKDACRNTKSEKDKYIACLDEEFKKDNDFMRRYNFLLSPNENQEDNVCLQKYNYLRFGIDELDCIWMGISIY